MSESQTGATVSIRRERLRVIQSAEPIVCGPAQACLISVTQATPSPAQEADAPISFG
jgi:hypothetical protein